MAFYDTAHAENRPEKKRKVNRQEQIILDFFQRHPSGVFSPLDVMRQCSTLDSMTPITSIRRAITDLTEDGHLEKTHEMKEGQYGVRTHTWRLKRRGPVKQLELL